VECGVEPIASCHFVPKSIQHAILDRLLGCATKLYIYVTIGTANPSGKANAVDNTGNDSVLTHLIAQQIAERSEQCIPFAEFMDLALYHPQFGYYATRAKAIGAQGDFFTSPHLGADFGELLAEQFVQMWEILQCPQPFTLVEMGAGQGLLALDILRYLHRTYPEFYACLEYLIVEKAAALITAQQRQLQSLAATGVALRWCSLADLPPNSITGCCFSNELVDAFPVHQFMLAAGQLQEVYVTAIQDQSLIQFRELLDRPSTDRLLAYFDLLGIELSSANYPDHYRSEINLAALDWITAVADRLHRGYVLTIDYGYPAQRYYHPARSEGTLQCYYQHAHHANPYIYVGQQDITAHVNFTALERQGEQCGLRTIGFVQQGLFLMALGLSDRIAALSQSDSTDSSEINRRLQQRDALHQLINPLGLGNFGVLIQAKGLADPPIPLKGLSLSDPGFTGR
jgi:SAM-dependent MidA family methyltransferase